MAKVSLRTWENRHKSPLFWLVTGLGAGMAKPGPGTWGSVVALPLAFGLLALNASAVILVVAALLLTVISSFAIDRIEAQTGIHDAPEIIIDEIAGQWLALLPLATLPFSAPLYGIAFVFFRIFDIFKPWPISWLDKKVGGGFGVMVDDLVAGIFSAISISILLTLGLLDGLY